MDAIDWINQVTSWLLMIDAALLLMFAIREAGRR